MSSSALMIVPVGVALVGITHLSIRPTNLQEVNKALVLLF